METLLSILVGIGLSAACGFRIFVPLLIAGVAARSGHLSLAKGFAWMGSDAALIAFSLATALEVAAYYVPWLDHLLDTVATPAAIVAGTLVTASLATDLSPFFRWTLAVIAGGGVAGLVQGTTVLTRGISTAATAGVTNPIVATSELGGSLLTSVLALVAPALVGLALCGFVGAGAWLYSRRRRTAVSPPGA